MLLSKISFHGSKCDFILTGTGVERFSRELKARL